MTDTPIIAPQQGSGPGLVLISDRGAPHAGPLAAQLAEEGYAVLAAEPGRIAEAAAALRAAPCHAGMVGALAFGDTGETAGGMIDCFVAYEPPDAAALIGRAQSGGTPSAIHLAGPGAPGLAEAARFPELQIFAYPDCAPGFAIPGDPGHSGPHAAIAYSRTIAALRRVLGPYFDLGALWEAHVACEFTTRDAAAAMATMVDEPYVNHVPTMIGGYGHDLLMRFYEHHFIPQGPKDRKVIPISRTIGPDRVVQEQVLCFTHDAPMDWLLPGVPATGRYIEIPLVAIVTFRGGKLYNEHIYWDQASVLVQAGLLDAASLPVTGRAQAAKLIEPSLPGNNDAMPGWSRPSTRPG